MRPSAVTPTGVETTFPDSEIIVSKTDLKGIITYANDVFIRVSKYAEGEVLGKPHNVIRHPDMPRCVFGVLWERIASGAEIFAYVMNLCADGSHYWVLAHVTPTIIDGRIVGYHSNRRTPSRQALGQIKPLYSALLAEERKHSRPQDAIAAGSALLHDTIARSGAVDYDKWVWSLEPELESVS